MPVLFFSIQSRGSLFQKGHCKKEIPVDDQTIIIPKKENYEFIYDEDGFVVRVKDSSDNLSHERICPYCHNPLPHMYGKYPMKRIVLTGATGCGKTVYLSSLLRNIQNYCASVNITCSIQSPSIKNYVQNNTIEIGRPLPQATCPDRSTEPLPIDIQFLNNDGISTTVTIVFYDVDSEEITSSNNHKPNEVIKHADGIILLQDPKQFETQTMYADLLHIINTLIFGNDYCSIPIAVCISKCDSLIDDGIFSNELVKMLNEPVKTAENFRGFCAVDYNGISKAIDSFYRQQDTPTRTALRTYFDCFNYFAVSSLNCKLIVSNENKLVPAEAPHPMRIEDPLYWLLYQFGLINSDEEIIDHAVVGKLSKLNEQREMLEKELSKAQSRRFGRRRVQECEDNLTKINQLIKEIMNS